MSSTSNTRKTGEGNLFTLVELLIVISIIAILASILLPALKNAKEKASEITCKNKMKQIHTSFLNYTQDYNGQFPLCLSGTTAWFGSVFAWDYMKFTPQHLANGTILKEGNPVHCTSNKTQYNSTWFVNYAFLQNIDKKISGIHSPSEKIILMETGIDSRYQFWQNDAADFGWRAVMGRPHRLKSNVLFVDGHVDAASPNDLTTTTNFRIND